MDGKWSAATHSNVRYVDYNVKTSCFETRVTREIVDHNSVLYA